MTRRTCVLSLSDEFDTNGLDGTQVDLSRFDVLVRSSASSEATRPLDLAHYHYPHRESTARKKKQCVLSLTESVLLANGKKECRKTPTADQKTCAQLIPSFVMLSKMLSNVCWFWEVCWICDDRYTSGKNSSNEIATELRCFTRCAFLVCCVATSSSILAIVWCSSTGSLTSLISLSTHSSHRTFTS